MLGFMAVFGSLPVVRAQLAHDARFAAAFDYVVEALNGISAVRRRIGALAIGAADRIELTGGAFAMEQAYEPKSRPEGFFESHRKYIDVQVNGLPRRKHLQVRYRYKVGIKRQIIGVLVNVETDE